MSKRTRVLACLIATIGVTGACSPQQSQSADAAAQQSPATSMPLLQLRMVHADSAAGRTRANFEGGVLYLDPEAVITDPDFAEVSPEIITDGRLQLRVVLDSTAAARLERVTAQNVGRRMAILFQSQIVSVPVINASVGRGSMAMGLPVAEPERAAALIRARWPAR